MNNNASALTASAINRRTFVDLQRFWNPSVFIDATH